MTNPVVLLLVIVLLVVLVVGHGVCVTLPRLVWAQWRTVWRAFGRAAPVPPDPRGEPAVPSYLAVTASRDLRATWWDGLEQHERLMGDAERFTAERVGGAFRRPGQGGSGGAGCLMVFLRPVSLLTGVGVVLTATAVTLLPLLSALTLWALCRALWSLWWAAGAAVARAERALRRGRAPCPYADCGRVVDRPVRVCPKCRARHRRLVPGRYGVFLRRCRCGARLPAVLRVHRLEARCPHCRKALPPGYERARVVVLVGGPAARRAGVHRQGLADLGVPPGTAPPLVRTAGTPVLWYDPSGDAYGSQESAAALADVLRRARGLLLAVDDPAAHGDAVRAVTRVLHVLLALPPRSRPRRLALLYSRAVRGDDTAVRRRLEEAGGGHLLRALDGTGLPVRCVPAGPLGGTVRWLAGAADTAGAAVSMAPPPARPPAHTTYRYPRHRVPRHTLLLAHLAGYVAVPLVLTLLETSALPPSSFGGLPQRYAKWRHPLTGTVHQIDLAAAATYDWPRLRASYAAPGHPPSAALPGHAGYWSVDGSPRKGGWLRVDFGMPLPLDEVSVDFDPDSVPAFTEPADVEGQVGARTVVFPDKRSRSEKSGPVLTKTYGYDITVPEAVDSVRVGLGSLFDKSGKEARRLRLREFHLRWSSSDALRLRPADGGRLAVENTTTRDLAVTVRPPLLPTGWHATPVGRPPRILRAHAAYEARWRITAPDGTTRRAPVAYAVDITEDGRTVTARRLALLTAALKAEPLA
ncbi:MULTISPECIES: hypothetical protein [Streptomyces]|uniref:hypothetical protein n=1 Tax=Streptomyces TaxID=1883 RepID=UPI00163CDCC7|nr:MULTISPECIES: hypothetical protein [Streptomyces]MBC2877652.1 hypothetical protein [Streptomyces sp. TYQ1024]UBI36118.1 hypothetical protein K7I03_06355 [Streptomyces mobaraensis]UKW28713.1 hypothetical protein MCU78_06340 [Streptomyces sp. TYQ1024]